jgi:putative spermidine/putrescine transport system ATP-binding protein
MEGVTSRAIEIDGVRKCYGSFVAIDRVSLSITPGSFVTLLGPSGSGKTTLLQIIAGLTSLDEGRVVLGDRDVTSVPTHEREIGMVFQNYALFPHLDIFENIAFPLRLRRVNEAEIDRRVRDALEMINLAHVANRKAGQLSGGQQQRIALARALVYRPGVLLMDEPLGALDRKLRDQMKYEIKSIQKEIGITVVYVTHDQDEALTMSDEVAVMNQGRIVQLDTPRRLYQRPATRFVADFIGDSNLIPGHIAADLGGHVEVQTAVGKIRCQGGDRARAVGQSCSILIRPEHGSVEIAEAAPGSSCVNVLTAEVVQSLFRGESTELSVHLRNGTLFRLKQQGTSDPLKTGQRVSLFVDPTEAITVAEDADAPLKVSG